MSVRPAWVLRSLFWDIYFVVIVLATAAICAANRGETATARAGAVSLLAAIAIWYAAVGRPAVYDDDGWHGYLYMAVALALLVPAAALVGSATFILFALCPQAFLLLPALPATGFVLVGNAIPVAVFQAETGDLETALGDLAPTAGLIVVASAAFGTWAQRVVAQSQERAELIQQLDASRAEVARLSHEAGVLAERQRLAGDIHDTIAQGLSSVIMLIQAADAETDRRRSRQHLALALDTARDNLTEARSLIAALTPAALATSSLPEALDRLAPRFGATFRSIGAVRPLPTAVDVVLLRAAQESLSNAGKHADAQAVEVTLHYCDGSTVLEVRDDGRGFTPGAATTGYGLRGMRARVEQVDGTLAVDSTPGVGTVVRVEVPVP